MFTGGFALQSYKGAQKPTPMEVMKAQATRLAEDPTNFKAPPKMEIPTMEGMRRVTRTHKLKHRDMNVLTPSGFWETPYIHLSCTRSEPIAGLPSLLFPCAVLLLGHCSVIYFPYHRLILLLVSK